jgi:hypothetical protein
LARKPPALVLSLATAKKAKKESYHYFCLCASTTLPLVTTILRILGQVRTGGKYLIIIKVKHMKIIEIPALIVLHAEVENIRNKRWVLSF